IGQLWLELDELAIHHPLNPGPADRAALGDAAGHRDCLLNRHLSVQGVGVWRPYEAADDEGLRLRNVYRVAIVQENLLRPSIAKLLHGHALGRHRLGRIHRSLRRLSCRPAIDLDEASGFRRRGSSLSEHVHDRHGAFERHRTRDTDLAVHVDNLAAIRLDLDIDLRVYEKPIRRPQSLLQAVRDLTDRKAACGYAADERIFERSIAVDGHRLGEGG